MFDLAQLLNLQRHTHPSSQNTSHPPAPANGWLLRLPTRPQQRAKMQKWPSGNTALMTHDTIFEQHRSPISSAECKPRLKSITGESSKNIDRTCWRPFACDLVFLTSIYKREQSVRRVTVCTTPRRRKKCKECIFGPTPIPFPIHKFQLVTYEKLYFYTTASRWAD